MDAKAIRHSATYAYLHIPMPENRNERSEAICPGPRR
jgi:hypothetical protein